MQLITYEFDELEILPGFALFAHGWAEISYEIEPDDPDVGYRGGACFTVEEIFIAANEPDHADYKLDHDSFLYLEIEKILHSSKHDWRITEECEEYENNRNSDDY